MTQSVFALVIGAGPAGATAARELLQDGLGPVTLVEKRPFPRVKPCASGLSPAARRILDQQGLLPRIAAKAYPIHSALIQAPSERAMHFAGGEGTLVLARKDFDQLLVDIAVAAGATFMDNTRIRRIEPGPTGQLSITGDPDLHWHARWVIVATGGAGGFAGTRLPESSLVSTTGWYHGVDFEPHRLEMYFDRDLAPHYGWLFPEAPDRVNIGICLDGRNRRGRPVHQIFESFLDRHFRERLSGAELVHPLRGHPITAARTIPVPDVPDGVLVAGEAARLANRATGEGISQALKSGQLAADAIRQGIGQGWSSARVSRWYLAALHRHLGPGLWLADRFADLAPPALDAMAWLSQNGVARAVVQQLLARL